MVELLTTDKFTQIEFWQREAQKVKVQMIALGYGKSDGAYEECYWRQRNYRGECHERIKLLKASFTDLERAIDHGRTKKN